MMATDSKIIEKYAEEVICKDGEEAYAIVGGYMDLSLRKARNNERKKCIKEFKKIVQNAINEAIEKNGGGYDEWTEADALEIIENRINNMK